MNSNSLGTGISNKIEYEKIQKTTDIDILDLPIILNKHSHIYHNLCECIDKFLKKEQYYRLSTSAILKLCLLDMAKENVNKSSSNKTVTEVLDYIHHNYANTELTNEKIADTFGYHPYYLSSTFKRVKGKTLHKYIMDYRIRIAANLLITTDYDISTIAWKSGFNSTSYFIKCFCHKTGLTPKVYKKNNIISAF